MTMNTVSNTQRYRQENPCPVCGGWDSQRRGIGQRCHGYLSTDGRYARCSREAWAGALPLEVKSGCYVHLLNGQCNCGTVHGNSLHSGDIPQQATPKNQTSPGKQQTTRYQLRDAAGTLIAFHPRVDFPDGGKTCWYETATGARGLNGLPKEALPLFGSELLLANHNAEVVLTEGEKAAAALQAAGVLALGTATGASVIPNDTVLASLRGHPVILWPDNDTAGQGHMAKIANALERLGISYCLLTWPEAPPKGDAHDFLATTGKEALPAFLASAVAPAKTADVCPDFPVGALPATVRHLVETGAAALDVDPAFIAVPLLGFAASTIGRSYCIEVKPGYRQWPILYVAVVGPPGSGKTPALALAREPLDRLQEAAWQRFQEESAAYRADLAAWELQRKKGNAAAETRPEPPTLAHFFTTDATIESLGTILSSSAGLAYIRDELVAWVRSCDQYRSGKGTDRQKWLGAWSKEAWKIDRKKSEPLYIPHPTVSVIGGVQPEILGELAHEAGARDGFIDRILWTYPPEHYPDDTDAVVSPATVQAVYTTFASLRSAQTTDATTESLSVRLSTNARQLFRAWHRDNTRLLRESSGLVQGIYAKLPNQLARLALIIHCLTYPDAPAELLVDDSTMQAAIELAEYFRTHAHRVLPRFGATAAGATSLVGNVAAILADAAGAWINRSTIRDQFHRNCPAAEITQALQILAEQGLAESRLNREGQGRPAEEWRSCSQAETRKRGKRQSGGH